MCRSWDMTSNARKYFEKTWFENWYLISVTQFVSYSTQYAMWFIWTRFIGFRYSVMDRITLLIFVGYAAHMSIHYSAKNDGSRTGSGSLTRLFTSATWVTSCQWTSTPLRDLMTSWCVYNNLTKQIEMWVKSRQVRLYPYKRRYRVAQPRFPLLLESF